MPVPAPDSATPSEKTGWNVAVTLRAWLIETTHDPVPVQSPLQPVNVEPVAAVAVSVSEVFSSTCAVHATPQSMPASADATVPEPVPALATVSVRAARNVAVTLRAWLIVTTQVSVPLQPSPDQPANVEPVAAVAESVTVSVLE